MPVICRGHVCPLLPEMDFRENVGILTTLNWPSYESGREEDVKPGGKLGQGCGGTSLEEGKRGRTKVAKGGKINKLALGPWGWE